MSHKPIQPSATPHAVRAVKTSAVQRVASGRLLDGARELVIEHHGSEYHLRVTRNDKLILTK
nr:hemin uptake protein HemP [Oleiagrimonas soli]